MGYVISLGLDVISTAKYPNNSPQFKKQLKTLIDLKNNNLTDWEKLHVKATELMADGYYYYCFYFYY